MPRGRTPRQPARTGRQDRVARTPLRQAHDKLPPAKAAERRKSTALGASRGLSAPVSPVSQQAPKERKKIAASSKPPLTKNKGYNPLAPDRIAEILKRLDQL